MLLFVLPEIGYMVFRLIPSPERQTRQYLIAAMPRRIAVTAPSIHVS